MRDMLMAGMLSALVWPGAGQFYNREFRKGLALVLLTFLLGLSLMIGLGKDIAQHLPADPSPFDPEQIRRLRDVIIHANPRFYRNYSLILTATWFYSVVDAYLGARDRAAAKKEKSPPEPAP
jgi:hypothetical protein